MSTQNKFGYLDSQEILLLMPEHKSAEKELQEFKEPRWAIIFMNTNCKICFQIIKKH